MKGVDIFAWGFAAGYVVRALIEAGKQIAQARRDAKAKIERALANRERQS